MSNPLSKRRALPTRLSRVRFCIQSQWLLSARTAVAAGAAWVVAQAVEPQGRPYFAPIAVVIIVRPTIHDSFSQALQRVTGVILGVAAALVASHFLSPGGWSIGLIVFGGLLLGRLLDLGSQGVSQICISALLVFLVGHVATDYGSDRIIETGIGAAVAVVAVLVVPSSRSSNGSSAM